MAAAETHLPVLGVPVESKALRGMDSLLSIAQMPAGVPVGTLAIGRSGAVNAALLAASIVASDDQEVRDRRWPSGASQTAAVLADPDPPRDDPSRHCFGGGQLGRMLALAALPLDVRCVTVDPATDSPAAQVAPSIVGAYDDPDALVRLAEQVDVVTYEFENVPVEAIRALEERVPVFPPPVALEASQDRMAEKRLFERVGLRTAVVRPRGLAR